MPAKNVVRDFRENSYYHIYNRGIAQAEIFLDEQDYKVFISLLKLYLENLQVPNLQVAPSKLLKNFSDQIDLIAYCLMPNHFHLLIFQNENRSMAQFLKSLTTKYSMYFNKKYQRQGPVFQGKYKSVLVDSEEQFLYLTKYIHRNPLPAGSEPAGLENYKYSSYQNYLGLFQQVWLKPDDVLTYFNSKGFKNSYKEFVEETDESDILRIKNLTLDLED